MFFEGSEKKLELIVTPRFLQSGQFAESAQFGQSGDNAKKGKNGEKGSLRQLGREFWQTVVRRANADILSTLSNGYCDAYLLSESSLFVWNNRALMLTCGNTRLADAACYLIDAFGEQNIAFVSYQRKNEYLSHLQQSTFAEDLKAIRERLAGDAFRIGHLDSHHHYLYTSSKPFLASPMDETRELLMYHIRGDAAEYLRSSTQSAATVRALLRLDTLLPGFEFDDHLFSPFGYSINGLCDDYYMTIHITPQENSSYVSFETNLPARGEHRLLFSKLLSILNPGSWDEIGFNSASHTEHYPAHLCLGSCELNLTPGYRVSFCHYQQLCHEELMPEPM
ncbi:adenosylmethionine decarboxylase [Shewanella sp. JM162201]|uniref:Adenosylmethionine decarboxylase n=1 Tax=Shewanella jiangmenensis TaxID=2837387 RepID=A0ABS5V6R1_9GAMM|nr:adenosylmethionine decarboxylase [Shewanella jiangmenensis]MBT1445610.1 adenosylmethionine decarboxylase [Shewanella jiangmenensis]